MQMANIRLKDIKRNTIGNFIERTEDIQLHQDIQNIEIEQLYNNPVLIVNCTNAKRIFNNTNMFVKFYLLFQNTSKDLKLDYEDSTILRGLVNQLTSICNDFNVEITDKIYDLVLNKTKKMDTTTYIKILSSLELSNEKIEDLRKFLGYNMLYRVYKDMIDEIYIKHYTYKDLGLAMALLNNEKLCFSQTLDTFNRLNEYISKGIVDKNLVSCCSILIALLEHTPNMLSNKVEFLTGITTYLLNILFERSNFTIYNQHDTDIIIKTISRLCLTNAFRESSNKLKIGIIRKCLFHIRLFITTNSTNYEETMSFIALLKCLGYFLGFCSKANNESTSALRKYSVVVLGNEKYQEIKDDQPSSNQNLDSVNFNETVQSLLKNEIIEDLEKYQVPESICLGYKDNSLAKERLVAAKYFALDQIAKIRELNLNRVHFYNDVYAQQRPKYIFKSLDRLKMQVTWSDLIILASHSSYKSDYIPLLLDSHFIKNPEHLSYIQLFIFSLKDDLESLVILVSALTKLDDFNGIDKYWEILIFVYVFYLDSDDQRIVKTRSFILKKILNTQTNNIELVVDILMSEVKKDNLSMCKNLFPLFYFVIFNLQSINDGLFDECYGYLITCTEQLQNIKVENQNERHNSSIEFSLDKLQLNQKDFVVLQTQSPKVQANLLTTLSTHRLSLSLLIHLLMIKKPNRSRIIEMGCFDKFSHCLALTSYCHLVNEVDDFLYQNLFEMILTCEKKQQTEIYKVLKTPKQSKYLKCYKILCKLKEV